MFQFLKTDKFLVTFMVSLMLIYKGLAYSNVIYPVFAQSNNQELAQLNTITNPKDANANLFDDAKRGYEMLTGAGAALSTVYDVYCSIEEFDKAGKCGLNNNNWVQSSVHNIAFNIPVQMICDKTFTDLSKGAACVNAAAVTEAPSPSFPTTMLNPKSGGTNWVRVSGGFGLGQVSSETLYALTNDRPPIPTNLALYMDRSFGDTIFGTRAYAQKGPMGNMFEGIVYNLWIVSRNIALSMFGILLAGAGVMVMLRRKTSPQVTVSIYSVLPMIPVSLAIILLGYPLIALAYTFIGPLNALAINLALKVIGAAFNTSMTGYLPSVTAADDIWTLIMGSINAAVGAINLIRIASLFAFLLVVGMLMGTMVAIVYSIVTFARIYVSLIYSVISSPVVGLMSIIPGKQGLIMNLLKRILVDVISLPVLIIQVAIGMAILAYIPGTGDASNVFGAGINLFFGPGMLMMVILLKFFIGMTIIFKSGRIRKTLEQTFGVEKLFATGGADPKRR